LRYLSINASTTHTYSHRRSSTTPLIHDAVRDERQRKNLLRSTFTFVAKYHLSLPYSSSESKLPSNALAWEFFKNEKDPPKRVKHVLSTIHVTQ
jgi:hypothetical protein